MRFTYLSTVLALSLFTPAVHPVVVRGRLLAILSYPHVPERRLARQLGPLHQRPDAIHVGDYFARRALDTRTVSLGEKFNREGLKISHIVCYTPTSIATP